MKIEDKLNNLNNRYSEVAPIIYDVRYRNKIVDLETYLHFMYNHGYYYYVADKLVHLMTEDELSAYNRGKFPKWFSEAIDIYEIVNFGTKQ